MTDTETREATPLPSATVVLIREVRSGPEVLLVQRHAQTSFGATYVFPGGLVETADRQAHRYCIDDRAARADACLDLPHDALDYYSAAVRELFEETGVLLARGADGEWALSEPAAPAFDEERRQLNGGRIAWADILRRHDLSLACDSLHYFAHWITPVRRKKRFTTRFFVAALPEGQRASHDGTELTDSRWLSPAEALVADRAGSLALPPPTRVTLTELADKASVSEVLDWARRREAGGVPVTQPAIVGGNGNGRDCVVMPGDPRYPRTDADEAL